MNIFLDDIRLPKHCLSYMYMRIGELNPIYIKEDWVIVRNYDDFCQIIDKNKGKIKRVSFDHDLSDKQYDIIFNTEYSSWEEYYKSEELGKEEERTGYSCAKYLKEVYDKENLEYPHIIIHSMNIVGSLNIQNLFKL